MLSSKNLSDKSLLVILDGFGLSDNSQKNAIISAETPFIDSLFKTYPTTQITAGGTAVGLPKGVAGNSEVGHLNLGSGRPVRQDLVRINEAIEQKALEQLPEFIKMLDNTKKDCIHLMGLLSDGGVHSHIDHIKYIIDKINSSGKKVFFHAFMDGRDTPKTNGVKYLKEIGQERSIKDFEIASIQGRSIGMDRDRRWEKIEHAVKTLAGAGRIESADPLSYLEQQYAEGLFDEFVTPTLFSKDSAITDEDTVFFINFRPDRARQITLALAQPEFNEFEPIVRPHYFLCMTPYVEEEVELPILFDKEKVKGGLSEYLSEVGIKQFKIAETEKYAHVTYFFNGGEKQPFPGEIHKLIESPREVKTYDEKPEMSAYLVTDALIEAIESDQYKALFVNYANSDMVGHTGNFEAAVKAIEALDKCLAKLIPVCLKNQITVLLTADHGNSDQMVYPDGGPHTSHTGAPVPFSLISDKLENQQLELGQTGPALKDVAPTFLWTMGIDIPDTFTGKPVFK